MPTWTANQARPARVRQTVQAPDKEKYNQEEHQPVSEQGDRITPPVWRRHDRRILDGTREQPIRYGTDDRVNARTTQ